MNCWQDVDHIVVLPLYPQYSCSTVAAVWDELARILAKKRAIPGISFIRDYADDASYIDALAASVRASFAVHGEPDVLLLSYHGIPRFAHEGDDYPQRCRDTTRELVSALGLSPDPRHDDLPVALWPRAVADTPTKIENVGREG
jgi:ferrochelatase